MMSNVVITLGAVTFQDFEVPEKIALGGAQRVAVHQLIGGGRVVDALGDAPAQIDFSGIFSGEDAAARAQILDAATAAGAQLPLFWDSFFYTVIIGVFSANYEKPWWIPFTISCVVVIDPVAEVASAISSVTTLIGNDIASAVSLAPQAGVSLALGGAPSLAGLGSAQAVVSSGMAAANVALTSGVGLLNGAIDAPAAIGGLAQVVSTSGQLAALSGMTGYINRAATNMANELT
jgi:hypothetical protein